MASCTYDSKGQGALRRRKDYFKREKRKTGARKTKTKKESKRVLLGFLGNSGSVYRVSQIIAPWKKTRTQKQKKETRNFINDDDTMFGAIDDCDVKYDVLCEQEREHRELRGNTQDLEEEEEDLIFLEYLRTQHFGFGYWNQQKSMLVM